ncbi:hypothetical protein BC962_0775 [Gillisia mitskevichiae]|uniref:Alpha-ketoglutarate decarboxylase n=1 Tax=Gillisia mitskevichiae TaxID=270921 RepID=A0A495PXC7_9FLAO|nr:alpha-ketoglutarate decarboxylase [Gillisia mitskevichiae]RKS55804.1 hypothetical protein BC962_0775 [Gillisia mitskevichiae]
MFSYRNHTLNIFLSFLVVSLLSTAKLNAQDINPVKGQTNNFWESVRFGGSLGLNFGKNRFTGIIAPSAIYDFNEIVSTGIGLNAAYAKQDNFKTTSLGGSVITLINPVRFLQLSLEFQELNINRKYELIGLDLEENYWVPALFTGIGYNTGNVTAGIRYDLLYDEEKSFYSSALMPFVSIYF